MRNIFKIKLITSILFILIVGVLSTCSKEVEQNRVIYLEMQKKNLESFITQNVFKDKGIMVSQISQDNISKFNMISYVFARITAEFDSLNLYLKFEFNDRKTYYLKSDLKTFDVKCFGAHYEDKEMIKNFNLCLTKKKISIGDTIFGCFDAEIKSSHKYRNFEISNFMVIVKNPTELKKFW